VKKLLTITFVVSALSVLSVLSGCGPASQSMSKADPTGRRDWGVLVRPEGVSPAELLADIALKTEANTVDRKLTREELSRRIDAQVRIRCDRTRCSVTNQ
jgi:hypothetical protein